MLINLPDIERFDRQLDEYVDRLYKEQPLAQDWARISKLSEETGEAIQALIGATGQNPRKGITNTAEDVTNELADVLFTAALAIQHFTKSTSITREVIELRWRYRQEKMMEALSENDQAQALFVIGSDGIPYGPFEDKLTS